MTDTVEVATTKENQNIWPPINMQWYTKEGDNPQDSASFIFTESQIELFEIHKINIAGFFRKPKYEYRLASTLKNPQSSRPIGGFFDTMDEAKRCAEKYATVIFRGLDFVRPGTTDE